MSSVLVKTYLGAETLQENNQFQSLQLWKNISILIYLHFIYIYMYMK